MFKRFALFFLLALALFAQSPTATLVGTVHDASGAVVPGAKLEIRNEDTNRVKTLSTGAEGDFTVPDLAPGKYTVTAEHEGFHRLVQGGLILQVDQAARLDLVLQTGTISESVEVHADAPLLNTENATKGEVINVEEITDIPLDGRAVGDLAMLVPGVTPKGQGASEGSPYSINGARNDNTNFLIDGFNNQAMRAGAMQANPPIDSVQEFKMQTTGYPAEYGRLAGGVMSMLLKSGGNTPHGSVFEYVRNDAFDARNFFDSENPKLRRNQFGASLNGPVVIPHLYNGTNRTFFLFSWESYRQVTGQPQWSRVPTLLERQGDFSQTVGANGKLVTVKDPVSGGNFPGNVIPASRISPVAQKLLDYYPLPNRLGANNYAMTAGNQGSWDSFAMKVDQHVFANDLLTVRYLPRNSHSMNPFAGSDLGTFGNTSTGGNSLAGIGYTHMFSPVLIDEFRFGFSRSTSRQYGAHAGTNIAEQVGIPGTTTDPMLLGFPLFKITGEANLGDSASTPILFTVNVFNYSDTLTYVKGRHLLKFGGEVIRTQMFQPYTTNNRGTFNFNGKPTSVPVADFLLGFPNNTTRSVGSAPNYLFASNYGFFAQDDVKVTPNLTLNIGMRYEIAKPPIEKYGRLANFIPGLNKVVLSNPQTVPDLNQRVAAAGLADYVGLASDYGLPASLIYANYNNLAPRFGFAWRPLGSSHTVVRSGYGIYYAGNEWNPIRNDMANIFPLVVSQSFNRVATDPTLISLSNPFPDSRASLTGTTNVGSFDSHPASAYMQTWNFTLEQEIGHEMALQVAYEGSKGTHLGRSYNVNQPFRFPEYRQANGTFPKPYPVFNTITMYGFGSNSDYHALDVSIRRRLASGFFYRFSYVFGKALDDASAISASGMSDGSYSGAQDARNLSLEHGRSDSDIRHNFLMSFVYETPFHERFLKGWQLAGSGRISSGQPFTPTVSGAQLDLGEASRPDRIAFGSLPNPSPERWFDIGAFPLVPSGAYRFGTSGRNILDGPGDVLVNMALMRKFSVGEKRYFQFRCEVFNVSNHTNFNLPDKTVNTLPSGTITSAATPRTLQFALRFMF